MFSYDEVFNASKEYFNGSELAANIFSNKYCLQHEGKYYELTPDDMHWRMAKEFARIEAKKFKKPYSEGEIYAKLKNFKKIVPQGSPMFGIGNPYQLVSISNCFVVASPEDSYGSICKTDEEIVQISKRRGGIGYDISNIRPEGFKVNNAARTTTGVVSFMHRFSNTGREVGQGGRRAAQMISISVHHPDIEKFIAIKADDVSVTGANISVRLSNEFLEAVEQNKDFELRWPVDSKTPKISKMVNAKELWQKINHYAWLRAEPGLLFWDNIIKNCPANYYHEFGFLSISTNPCGEITLSAYDSCRLLAMNLFGYVVNPYTPEAYFDYVEFYKDTQMAQRLMDDLVDLELECIDKIIAKIKSDPEDESIKYTELNLWKKIRNACENGRRTGLGITALGDTLAALGIKYGSPESITETEKLYQILKFGSYHSSVDMAKELGAFPVWNWELEKDCPFIKQFKKESIYIYNKVEFDQSLFIDGKDLYNDMKKYGRRNIANLTTAPTGTLSMLCSIMDEFNVTSGIEPAFMLSYDRMKKGNPNDAGFKTDYVDQSGDHWMKFKVYHSGHKLWMKVTGETDETKSPYYGACADDLKWTDRVKLQAAAQRHIDHSISSTVNIPENITEEEVAKIYEAAWKLGCKGVTVYRKNCRTGVLVESKEKEKITNNATKRPEILPCDIFETKIKGEKYFVIVGLMDESPYEIFAGKLDFSLQNNESGFLKRTARGKYQLQDKDGKIIEPNICDYLTDNEQVLTRLVSTALRHNTPLEFLVHQVEKADGELMSSSKIICRILKRYIKEGTKITGESCPECSSQLIRSEGCAKCVSCPWSKCN